MDTDNVLNQLSRSVEQQEAATENLAALVVIFWKRLHKGGLTREEATELTSSWLSSVMFNAQNRASDD